LFSYIRSWNGYQTARSQSLVRPGANFLTGIEHQTLGTSLKSRVIVPEKKPLVGKIAKETAKYSRPPYRKCLQAISFRNLVVCYYLKVDGNEKLGG
jgi:hypothetical protein